jgi:TonB-linked SusC/RagA family outer membrane protein
MRSNRRVLLALALVGHATPLLAAPMTPVPPIDRHAPGLVGSIRGRVVDRETNQGIVGAQVFVLSTSTGAQTDNNGNFVIRGLAAGTYTLRVSRIGYRAATSSATVVDAGEAVVNVALDHAVARLDEVVTTATGSVSRREIGNVVASLNADSLSKVAPITTVNDLLQARTSGVQVLQGQGVIGASSTIRIRGVSSLSLSNEPLIVVDGVRFSNEPEPGNTSAGLRINRLSTLDPEEIESLDIIKGPSAAALYGTAAANGVLVVKTKRGRVGAPRWSVFGELGMSQLPNKYPANYRSWGRNRNVTTGVIAPAPVQCRLSASAAGQCVIDSLTSWNPWTSEFTKPFGNGPTNSTGIQVSGGTEAVKYFVSVDRQNEVGPYEMPQFEIDRITASRGSAPREEQIHPNRLRNTSVRASFSFPIASTANLDVSTGYTDRDLWAPFDGTFFAGLSNQLFSAPGFRNATNGTAREFVGDIYSVQQRLQLERFVGSANFSWTPISWLLLNAEGGVDNGNSNNSEYQYPGEGTNVGAAWGPDASQGFSGIDITRTNSLNYTATVRAAATRQLASTLSSVTTAGAQWFRSGQYQLFGEGYGLGVGAVTLTAAQQRLATTTTTENATYGYFLQEQLGWRDRLFATLSARTDLNSAFGRSVGNTVYPAANLSYIISDESWFPRYNWLDRLRLRTSVGQAGLQPGATAALPFLQPLTYPSLTASGSELPGLTLQSLGNADLRPEVTTEVEGGFDLGLFRNRLNVELTQFRKTSRDQIFNRPLPPSFGAGNTQTVNIAKVVNAGVELAVDGTVIETEPFSWSMRINGSHIKNKLVDVGTVQLASPQGARNVVGYPLFGLWDRPYTFSDVNGDGIIVASEITLAAADSFRGPTLPEYEAGFSNTFGLFKNRIHINTLIDYRGNFWNSYGIGVNRCVTAANCPTVNVPGSSLEDQAAAVAASSGTLRNTRWGIFQPNDFIKLREISVSANLPESYIARFMRGRSAQIVFSGRNLSTLWTKYPGIDPEANRLISNLAAGNDDLGTPPSIRTFNVRLNFGF